MNKDQAEKLLADFFARFGKTNFAFGKSNFVKANIGEAILGFEYQKEEKTLACRALVFRFRNTPRPEVLREIEIAEKNGAQTGAGSIVFDFENLTLSLVRTYSKKIEPTLFATQMQKLATASLTWSGIILDRVASKSNG